MIWETSFQNDAKRQLTKGYHHSVPLQAVKGVNLLMNHRTGQLLGLDHKHVNQSQKINRAEQRKQRMTW
jgi:hypothetical protein